MYKYLVIAEDETNEHPSVIVKARTPEYAVAIVRGRGELPLDKPASVKYVQYSEKGEVIFTAGPTDETQLQLELLTMIAECKMVQNSDSSVIWDVVVGLIIFTIGSAALAILFQTLRG